MPQQWVEADAAAARGRHAGCTDDASGAGKEREGLGAGAPGRVQRRALAGRDDADRFQQDDEVEEQGVVLHVVQVVLRFSWESSTVDP